MKNLIQFLIVSVFLGLMQCATFNITAAIWATADQCALNSFILTVNNTLGVAITLDSAVITAGPVTSGPIAVGPVTILPGTIGFLGPITLPCQFLGATTATVGLSGLTAVLAPITASLALTLTNTCDPAFDLTFTPEDFISACSAMTFNATAACPAYPFLTGFSNYTFGLLNSAGALVFNSTLPTPPNPLSFVFTEATNQFPLNINLTPQVTFSYLNQFPGTNFAAITADDSFFVSAGACFNNCNLDCNNRCDRPCPKPYESVSCSSETSEESCRLIKKYWHKISYGHHMFYSAVPRELACKVCKKFGMRLADHVPKKIMCDMKKEYPFWYGGSKHAVFIDRKGHLEEAKNVHKAAVLCVSK